MNDDVRNGMTRRGFVDRIGLAGMALGLGATAAAAEPAARSRTRTGSSRRSRRAVGST